MRYKSLRSYHVEEADSRSDTADKKRRARFVLEYEWRSENDISCLNEQVQLNE